jgi:hypothetical protein
MNLLHCNFIYPAYNADWIGITAPWTWENIMAKVPGKKRRKSGVSAYFRPIFEEHPDLLDGKSNKELLQRWHTDHPGYKRVPGNVKQNLANLKSQMRKERREGRPGGKAGAPPSQGLASLEENIDDCLSQAKTLDRAGLKSVIEHLRAARNLVVWKMGR